MQVPAGWKRKGNKLTREFKFKDFSAALRFVNKVGRLAEKQQHHPDIIMHDWNKVRIESTTHDVGYKVTERDRRLARAINGLV